MAEGEESDDSQKTEDPTPKRLEEARKKGQVALSRELNNWVMLLAATLLIAIMGPSVMNQLTQALRIFIEQPEQLPQVPGGFSVILGATFWKIVKILALPLLVLMLAAIAGPFIQVGPLFAPESIHPDLSKVSPIKGWERIFSRRALMELVKGIFKLGLIGVVGFTVLYPYYSGVSHFVGLPLPQLLSEMLQLFVRLMIGILIALAVLAGIDVVYQRNEFMKKMRMTRHELKEEYKQSEGDPQIKAQLRRLRSEKARKRMMANVPKADVVITNPTHFAVALQYDSATMDAPLCVAKGADLVAARIRDVATEHHIAIVQNPPLARALYSTVDIDETVPPEHYKAVAEVISYVFKLKGKLK
jgi:flagellar biosynthetic protein FlhB